MDKKMVMELSNSTSMKDLLALVRIHGINTELECTNKLADIIGCKTVDELKEAAESDKPTFFFVLRYIWNMQDILNFYNNNCNSTMEALQGEVEDLFTLNNTLKAANNTLQNTVTYLRADNEDLKKKLAEYTQKVTENYINLIASDNKIKAMEDELVRLKAKLFDLMENER